MILVTGATGFLGGAVCKHLDRLGENYCKTSLTLGLNLLDRNKTVEYFESIKPKYVINCAAFVGGIQFGEKYPADIFSRNLQMTLNLLEACKLFRIERLINPISNCSYPGSAEFFKESEYWDGPLHESVMVYGFVRKASWVGSWAYAKQHDLDVLNLIFSNMYGPGDHFDEVRSHALGALIMKFVEAKKKNLDKVVIWGSGEPVREWLHVEDASEAMIRGLKAPRCEDIINVGIGKGISIIDMANLIKNIVGFSGDIVLDTSKQDGAPYKTLDGRRGQELLGWRPTKDFHQGVRETINWYIKRGDNGDS